jgi:hypothetical protein
MASTKDLPGNSRLLPQHLADLRASGLSDETITACRFRSVIDPAEAARLLGWKGPAKDLGACLVIPFLAPDGAVNGYVRLKPDRPRRDRKVGKPIKYESPAGKPNHAYLPPGVADALTDPSAAVFVTEGEKKAACATQHGFPCVGLVGVWGWQKKRRSEGGQKVGPRELIEDLRPYFVTARPVYLVFDSDAADKPDVAWAEWHLANALWECGCLVNVVRLPGGSDGEKVGLDDFLVAHGPAAFAELLKSARKPERPELKVEDVEGGDADLLSTQDPDEPENGWPAPLVEEAFHGLAGDAVRVLSPASEADDAALLFQFLVAFGNAVGRGPHLVVEADRHHANEFLVLVGRTSKGRKGTSWGQVLRLFERVEGDWMRSCIQGGLSSGEGLIWAVRDPITKHERVKKKGEVRYVEVEADPGVSDKRLLVFESEFANVLKQIERQGNVLSAVLRQAWDRGDLNTLVKNNPARATGAHVSNVGHITCEELRRYLSATESANGFGNRYSWACVQRSKLLPEGGEPDPEALALVQGRVRDAMSFALTVGQVRQDDEAREIWRAVYGDLSEGKPGLTGALLGRAEAHVMRLALIYALLDRSQVIRKPHLLAALACWDYVEASVRHVFGDCLGDPLADDLLRLLRTCPGGLTRTEISGRLGHNVRSADIGRALELLLQYRLARCERQETGGRSAERWYATARA